MTKKIPYRCKDLSGANLLECRDFTPSALDPVEVRPYLEHQERCKELADAGDVDEYQAEKCKREGHIMVPAGRKALRHGYPQPKHKSRTGKSYDERLRDLETPLTERTQSKALETYLSELRKAKKRVEKGANALLLESLTAEAEWMESQRGMEGVELIPGEDPAWFRIQIQKARKELEETGSVQAKVLLAELQRRQKSLLKRLRKGRRKFVPTKRGLVVPEHLYDVAFLVDMAKALGAPLQFEPTDFGDIKSDRVKSPIGSGGVRIEALRSGGSQVKLKDLLRRLMFKLQQVPDLLAKATGDSKLGLTASVRGMRKWLAAHPGETVEVVFRNGRVVEIPWAILQHSIVSKGADKEKPPDYKRLRNLTVSDLAEATSYKPRRKRRGRRLKPLPKARKNPMPTYVLNEADFTSLGKGEFWPLPTQPGKVVYRNSKGQLKVTTESRARAWRQYGQTAKELADIGAGIRKAESNPKERKMARRKKKFDPLAELMKEFGPTARKGRRIKRGSPKSAQGLGPFGARAAIPVNRRNPKKKRKSRKARKPSEWNILFGEITRRAAEIQRERGCPYKEAFDEARSQVAPGYRAQKKAAANPRPRRRKAGPKSRSWNYEQALGPYGSECSLPPNRRNPSHEVKVARFPAECVHCGRPFQSGVSRIVDSGIKGPRGGKKYAHVECI
tara:strand:+ start:3313 stop:5337 length:2025 start_codon:yes stop_codon:yes gene_type:complete